MTSVEEWRQKLLEDKRELEALSEDARASRGAVELDQQGVGRLSRMDAMQQQAMAIESERRRRARLLQIDAALRRIDQDDFGYCLKCGERIPEERLNFDPASAICVGCAGSHKN
jgi:DnaK suppressor protein